MFKISIKGKNESSDEFIKLMFIENANRAGINLKINDDLTMEEVEKKGITNLPAINVNGVFKSKENEDIIDFFRVVNSLILKERDYGTMKKIIVPIDFSDNSLNALEYAKAIAKSFNGVIMLISVFDNSVSMIEEMNFSSHELIKNHKKQLDDLRNELNLSFAKDDWHSPLIESEFKVGNVADCIMQYAEENENSMIVMGSRGETDLLDKIFGTISTAVAEKSKVPVLIIPPNVSFKQVNHLVYCSNDIGLDKDQMLNVVDVVKRCKPHIHLLHIDNENRYYKAMELLDLLKPNYLPGMVSYDLVFGDDKEKALSDYCNNKSIDMIALSKKDRGFFERLFHKSFAKEIIQNLKLPLMVVHGQ